MALKYNICSKLHRMPHWEYKQALKFLPTHCGKHPTTIHGYMYIKINEERAIPHDVLNKFASFFKCQVAELINRPKNYKEPNTLEEFRKFKEIVQLELKFPI